MPTPTNNTATNSTDAAAVQQAPRSPQEFQFAHRLLRKLVQDSTFFSVESAQRDYVWFPPRGEGDYGDRSNSHDNDGSSIDDKSNAVEPRSHDTETTCNYLSTAATSTTINNASSHPDENQQSHSNENQQQQQQKLLQTQIQPPPPRQRRRRKRTVSTPLFLDYCLRNYSAANNHNTDTTDNIINRRHGTLSSNDSYSYNSNNNNNIATQITAAPSSSLLRPSSPLSFCSYNSKYSCNSTVLSTNTATAEDHDESEDNNNHHNNHDNQDGADQEVLSNNSGGNSSSSVVTAEEGEEAVHPMVMAELSDGGTISGALTLNGGGGGCLEQDEGTSNAAGKTAASAISPSNQSASCTQEATNDATTSKLAVKKHVVHCIHEKDLEFGKILGSGGFGQVRLARIKNDKLLSSVAAAGGDTAGGGGTNVKTMDVASNAASIAAVNATKDESSCSNSNKYYAMKYLSPQKTSPPPPPTITNDQEEPTIQYVSKFERGIADLAMEARYLSVLSHENIVALWFVSEGRLEEVFNCSSSHGHGSGGKRRRRRSSSAKHQSKHNHDSHSNDKSSNGQGEQHQDQEHQQQHHHQHGYFLLLDALHETLHHRISHSYVPQVVDTPLRIYYPANKKSYSDNNIHTAKGQLAQRLTSLKSIAVALVYLHEECNLIYRDLKPSNIGFYRRYHDGGSSCSCGHDVDRGVEEEQQSSPSSCTCNYTDIPKLFDFGLAKELKSKFRKTHPAHSPDDPPTFKLTSATGSRRYMSPEVALREPYNHKADVYSFGMVLYQVASLVTPFHGLAMKHHEQVVSRDGLRPDVTIPSKDSSVRRTRDFRRHYSKEKDKGKRNLMLSKLARCVWPEGLNGLIAECWDDDMRKRPEMREVVERLDAFIEELNQQSLAL